MRFLVALALAFSAALPAYILIFGAPISDPDIAVLARLHLDPALAPRAILTFLYFPAVLALHFLIQPRDPCRRSLFLVGFSIFLLGIGIDAVYRSVQFLTVHGQWARELLAGGAAAAEAAAKLGTFNELAVGVTTAFSFLFAVGRLVMGAALLLEPGRWARLCGAGLAINGLWNLASVLAVIPAFAALSAIGSFYLWPWLAAILLAGAYAWPRPQATMLESPST